MLSTPPAFVLSQDQTLHKSKISLTKSPTSLAKIQNYRTVNNQVNNHMRPATTGVATSTHKKQSSTPKLNSHSKNKKPVFNKPSRLPAPSPNHRATQPVRQKCLVCYAIEFSNNMHTTDNISRSESLPPARCGTRHNLHTPQTDHKPAGHDTDGGIRALFPSHAPRTSRTPCPPCPPCPASRRLTSAPAPVVRSTTSPPHGPAHWLDEQLPSAPRQPHQRAPHQR